MQPALFFNGKEDVLRQMHDYYAKLLSKYKDVVTVQKIVALTFRFITRKSLWHIQTLNDFQRKRKCAV